MDNYSAAAGRHLQACCTRPPGIKRVRNNTQQGKKTKRSKPVTVNTPTNVKSLDIIFFFSLFIICFLPRDSISLACISRSFHLVPYLE